MLWVLKRTVSMRRFFEHPKHILKLMDKKLLTIILSKCLLCRFSYIIILVSEKKNLQTFTGK